MKYPASRMIGGSMNRKNTSGVRVEGGCSEVRNSRNPAHRKVLPFASFHKKTVHRNNRKPDL
jgi:hypothetical protein